MYLILATILTITLIYLLIVKPYNYWSDRGVKQRKQVYILGDNWRVLFRMETFFDMLKNLYDAFPEERYMGSYQMLTPNFVLRDPELVKQITVKDFDHFVDHRSFLPEGDELWSRNLFALKGNRWRDMRSTMSPTFTTSKMKMIFNLVSDCAEEFNKYFLNMASKGVIHLELKDICTRYTNDVIATVAFGVKCDSLTERENEFYMMGKKATSFTGFWKNLKVFMLFFAPKLCRLFRMSLFSKEMAEFFKRVVKEAITFREEKGIVRPDILHLLLEARKGRLKHEENCKLVDAGFATVEESADIATSNKIVRQEITDIDIAAQALIFFFGGFESVSTLMCFMGHELAANPDIHKKLQAEIDETLKECDGILTYEALLKMKYMDMVICETLRKWPVAAATDRICTKAYTIKPIRPREKPINLNTGDIIIIPIVGFHYDPQYFPEPERFDPERFSDDNKNYIKPYTYMPFGVGPRNCIGSRFALIETKTIFFHLLSKFDLVATEKTQIPLKLSKKSFNLLSDGGFWVGLKLRTDAN